MKKILSTVLVCTLILCVFSACGTAPQEASSAAPAGESSAASTAPSQEEPASSDSGDGENVLYTCKNYDYWGMDPATYAYYQTFALSEDVYEGLTYFDKEKNPLPRLALSWEVSDDYLEYTFTLRQGVQFHKGFGEMKASDVVFTFQRMKDLGADSTAGVEWNIDNIAIEALDDYTVKFTLTAVDPAFMTKMCMWCGFIVSEKAVKQYGADYERNPVGTGPFELVNCVANEIEEGARFKDYWGEAPNLDRVVCYYIADGSVMLNAFDAGELDLIYSLDDEKNKEYQSMDGVWIQEFNSPQIRIMSMNPAYEPLGNIKVREAILCAIDGQDFVDNFLMGMQKPTTAIVPEGDKYAKTGVFNVKYDLERAKSLLAEAGYPDGFDITLGVPNDQSASVAVVIQDYLAKININVAVETLEFASWMEKARAGEWPMWYLGRTSNVLPDTFFKFFMTDFVGRSNFSAYSNPDFDVLAKAAMSEPDEAKRTQAYADAQQYLADQHMIYPFYTLTKRVICKDYISGDIFDPCSTIRFQLVNKQK